MTLIIQIGLISLLVFAPLAFGSVEVWARSILELAVFGLAGLWLIQYGFARKAPAKLPGPVWVMLSLFAGWVLVQQTAAASLYPRGTRDALVLGIAYAVIFALVVSTVRTEREFNRLTLALVVIGFGVALFAIFQRYTWNGKMFWLREVRESGAVFGPFVNRNHFAGYIEMLIPLSIGYTVAAFAGVPAKGDTAWRRFIDRLTSERANRLTLLLFMTLVMSVSLVLSLSRTGILSFLVAVILIGMILLLGRATQKWLLLPGILFTVLLISLTWFGLGPIIDRVQTLLRITEDHSMLARVEVWKDTAKLVSDHPLMGSGLGTFGVVYPAYKTLPDQVFYEHTHNDYIQLLAETGWVGFGLSVGILGVLFGFIIAGWRWRRSPWAKGLLMGLVTGLVALLIHGLTDFNFHIPANAVLFAVLLGLAWNLARPEREEDTASESVFDRSRPSAAVAGLAVIGLLAAQTTAAFAADRYYRCGLELEKAGKLDRAGEDYRRAIGWDPAHPLYHMAMGELDERRYVQGDASVLPAARSEIERAAALAPTLAEPHLHLGWIRAQLRETASATEEFNRVLKLDPTNPLFQHYVGLWFAATGQTDRALGLARQLRESGQPAKAAEIEEKLKKT
ncbi:MAG: O-antigen ligase family protein [Nitrospirae bacterium]|nr:O-antigen ligase family protein [Nitrospirota bacterium]